MNKKPAIWPSGAEVLASLESTRKKEWNTKTTKKDKITKMPRLNDIGWSRGSVAKIVLQLL